MRVFYPHHPLSARSSTRYPFKEPTQKLLASDYIQNHRLGSVGVQHSARLVEDLDLIEKNEETGFWRVVDPVFAMWLRKQTEERV
jgi:hypothetical protein